MEKKNAVVYASLCGLICAAILIVFGQVGGHDFVNLDDDVYVTENPFVQKGIGPESLAWAVRTLHANFWHPLTWLSHMLDWQLFGAAAGGHHWTSVLIHMLSAVVLFLSLVRMTGEKGPSLFVALLFAVHPLHVESVAWVAERKDVLSGLFWMLGLYAYAVYAEKRSLATYLLLMVVMILGSMAKPMLVTLPLTLLLLDLWPLGRFAAEATARGSRPAAAVRLLWEKLPLIAIALVFGVVAIVGQQKGGALSSLWELPLGVRLGNAFGFYADYLIKAVWPVGLAPFYPNPGAAMPFWKIGAGIGALASATALALAYLRRRPFLAVGWFWFLITLLPVIGIIHVGDHGTADRYTYLPYVGLFIAIAWLVRQAVGLSPVRRAAALAGAAAVLVVLGAQAHRQAALWKNSETLFRHTLAATSDNALAHNNLGHALDRGGRSDEARFHFGEAVRIDPGFARARFNFGTLLERGGRTAEALEEYLQAARLGGDYPEAHAAAGDLLARQGEHRQAIEQYDQALALGRGLHQVWHARGLALAGEGDLQAAVASFSESLRTAPDRADVRTNLAIALARQGKTEAALQAFKEALAAQPGLAEAHFGLGNLLSRMGDAEGARREMEAVLKSDPKHDGAHMNLGGILARQGQYKAAAAHFGLALERKPDSNAIRGNLIQALWLAGDRASAQQELDVMRRSDPALADTILDRLSNMRTN